MATATHNKLAAVMIFVMLLGLGLVLWGGIRKIDSHGPVQLALDADQVAVSDSLGLVRLDPQSGALLAAATFAQLGIEPPLTDLQLLPDGRLLVAETNTGTIWQCDWGDLPCRSFAEIGELSGRFAKIHFDPASGRLLLAATHSNTLWAVQPPYGSAQAKPVFTALQAPNEIWQSPEGSIWVADTDHRQIVEIAAASPTAAFRPTGRTLAGHTPLSSRSFPLDFAGNDQDGWWVLLSDNSYSEPVLIRYDRQQRPIERIALPRAVDLTSVEQSGDLLLLADYGGFGLYRLHGNSASAFGDSAYQERLRQIRDEHERFRNLSWLGYLILGLGLSGALWVAILDARTRRGDTPLPTVAQDGFLPLTPRQGIYWLEVRPRVRLMLRWLLVMQLLLAPLILGLVLWLARTVGLEHLPAHLVILLATGMVVPLLFGIALPRLFPALGTDGRILFLRDGNRRSDPIRPARVRFNDNGLLLNGRLVMLRDGRGRTTYDQRQFDHYIRPLLPAANQLSRPAMLLYSVGPASPLFWPVLLMLVLLAALRFTA